MDDASLEAAREAVRAALERESDEQRALEAVAAELRAPTSLVRYDLLRRAQDLLRERAGAAPAAPPEDAHRFAWLACRALADSLGAAGEADPPLLRDWLRAESPRAPRAAPDRHAARGVVRRAVAEYALARLAEVRAEAGASRPPASAAAGGSVLAEEGRRQGRAVVRAAVAAPASEERTALAAVLCGAGRGAFNLQALVAQQLLERAGEWGGRPPGLMPDAPTLARLAHRAARGALGAGLLGARAREPGDWARDWLAAPPPPGHPPRPAPQNPSRHARDGTCCEIRAGACAAPRVRLPDLEWAEALARGAIVAFALARLEEVREGAALHKSACGGFWPPAAAARA
jgi:hypothetical protein